MFYRNDELVPVSLSHGVDVLFYSTVKTTQHYVNIVRQVPIQLAFSLDTFDHVMSQPKAIGHSINQNVM